ncbi:MAG: hypothetical protein JSS39_17295 [Nitrospira sp.]|nr:hypothetical protein [Nitrospira sp.]
MSFDIEKEKQRLAQGEFLKWVTRPISPAEMMTVYLDDKADDHNISIYCALIPSDQLERSLNDPSWDLNLGDGLPGSVRYHCEGETQVKYLRFGDDDGIEPLVVYREFYDMREDYREVSEEFRFFHRLYHDRKQDRYIKIDDSGNEHLIAVVEPNLVQIRLQEIRQFLAIKDAHLAVMFDCGQRSRASLGNLGLEKGVTDHRGQLLSYTIGYGDFGSLSSLTEHRAFSRLLGKRLFPPLPKEKSGLWGFAQKDPKKCIEFIIGQKDDGTEVVNTSDHDRLANFSGASPGQPNYLTPVHFRKQVLDKYYQQPSKYSVEDGYLRCSGLWGMTMDNHHDDRVVAWLGDLGRDLPYEEQLHWRSHNIPPAGRISNAFFQRQLLAHATDSAWPEHGFKSRYQQLDNACDRKLGWKLLLPLSPEDAHYFSAIRVPATDEQKDFDDLVGSLAKILVDSLNEKELNKLIPASEHVAIKGSIARLEKACMIHGVQGCEEHVEFLRKLQNLRSSGVAHRKGDNYQKIAREFGVESYTLRTVFQGILRRAVAFLEFFHGVVQGSTFAQGVGESVKKNSA